MTHEEYMNELSKTAPKTDSYPECKGCRPLDFDCYVCDVMKARKENVRAEYNS